MSDIAFLIASANHGKYLPSLLAEHNLNYPVYAPARGVQTDAEAIACAQHLVDEGTKVIITTGRYPELLLPHINIPILTLNYSSVSFACALSAARKISSRVACFLRYGRIYSAALRYKSNFHDKVLLAGYEDDKDCLKALEYLRAHRIEVIVCGGRGGVLAEKYGYQFEVIQVSFESEDVRQAVSDAEHIMHYTLQAHKENAKLKAIQDGAALGIISVNGSGIVEYANPAALDALRVSAADLLHKTVENTILQPLSALPQGTAPEPIRLGNHLLLASAAPLPSGEGVAYTIMGTEQLQKNERKLRRSLYANVSAIHSAPVLQSIDHHFGLQWELARHYAKVNSPLLFTGPSGSGKRTLAHYIHEQSGRTGPFIAIHCAALADDAETESFLFGHNAVGGEAIYGQFELANGGTLYLNEIGSCPAKLQAKLLRVFQTGAIIEAGSGRSVPLDLRIIASSRENLLQLIREGRFREDLYYSISVLQINISALNERPEDILPLLQLFLKESADKHGRPLPRLTPTAQDHFVNLKYPGNVRQLANMAERLVVLSDGGTVDSHLAHTVSDTLPELPTRSAADMKQNVDEQLVREALSLAGGNRAQAARHLGISPTTLWRKMKTYGLL